MLKLRRTFHASLMGGLLLLVVGCTPPPVRVVNEGRVGPPPKSGDPGMVSNIVRVTKFFTADPWLAFSGGGSGLVDGFRFSVYLEGPDSPKGVFGDGTIVVTMYRLDMDLRGQGVATQVYEWQYPPDKAYPWRVKKETLLGWGYGMRLRWDPQLDIYGKQVAVVVSFIRKDGRVVRSSRQVLRVPPKPRAAPLPAGRGTRG